MNLTRRIFLTVACALALCGTVSAQMGANLCPPASADCVAVASGSWQDAATWDGKIPQQGDRVFIPAGVTVTNHATTADVLWIHVQGALQCCDHCDTRINVHTLYVPHDGALKLSSTGTCTVEFLPGPFLPGDTTKLSRGLICHGEFVAKGNEKQARGIVLEDLPIGAASFKTPGTYGWKVGDKLVITGTDGMLGEDRRHHVYQSEFVVITGILVASDGTSVTFDPPLKYRHFRWKPDMPFHVGNLTRNVVFRSRGPYGVYVPGFAQGPIDTDHRGHLMFMSSMCRMENVAVEGCGRTDGSQPVTDPRTDLYGDLIPGSDTNVRARYAVHWHRIGQLSQPAICTGCVVDGSPKWGFLIHDSVAHVRDCIATRCYGSGFATEEGQERGSFVRCLSVLNRGLGDTPGISSDADHGRDDIGDWGIDGSGFWLQGGGVDVIDCVACDNSGRGFALFNRTLNGYPNYGGHVNQVPWIRYPIEVNGTLLPVEYNGIAATPASTVPQRVFRGNTAYCNKIGLQAWSGPTLNSGGGVIWPASVRANLTDMTLWGRGAWLHLEYHRRMNVSAVRIVGDRTFRDIHSSIIKSHAPVLVRSPDISITGCEITGMEMPISYVGTPADWPSISVDGDWPIWDKHGNYLRQ